MVSKSGNKVNTTLVLSFVHLYISFKTHHNWIFSQESLEIYVADVTNNNIYKMALKWTKLNITGLIIRSTFSKKEGFFQNRNA